MTGFVDLTVKVNSDICGPISTIVKVETAPNYRRPSKEGAKFNSWVAATMNVGMHSCSHDYVPSHVSMDGCNAERPNIEATVLRLTHLGESHGITVSDIDGTGTEVKGGEFIFLNTGWSDKIWGKFPDYYVRPPYLTVEAADWQSEKKPLAVGFDFFEEYNARLKDFKSDDFAVHHALLDRGMLLFEQMTNILSAPDHFRLLSPTIRLSGIDGTPARFIAEVE